MEMHPTYTLRITIQDRRPQTFAGSLVGQPAESMQRHIGPYSRKWYTVGDTIGGQGSIGCDQVLADVKKALATAEITAEVMLDRFEHRT